MTPATLALVPAGPAQPPAPQTVAQRVRQLQAEARQLAAEHAQAMAAEMAGLAALAEEIERGGEAYTAGVRGIARTVAQDLRRRLDDLQAIQGRRP